MTRLHTEFQLSSADDAVGRFVVISDGCEPGMAPQPVAELWIDITLGIFQIVPREIWIEARVIPPHLVLRGADGVDKEGYYCGDLARQVVSFVQDVVESRQFPQSKRAVL